MLIVVEVSEVCARDVVRSPEGRSKKCTSVGGSRYAVSSYVRGWRQISRSVSGKRWVQSKVRVKSEKVKSEELLKRVMSVRMWGILIMRAKEAVGEWVLVCSGPMAGGIVSGWWTGWLAAGWEGRGGKMKGGRGRGRLPLTLTSTKKGPYIDKCGTGPKAGGATTNSNATNSCPVPASCVLMSAFTCK